MFFKQIVIVFSSCVLVSCADTGQPVGTAHYDNAGSRSDCISSGTIRDYRVLDDANLIVTVGGGRKYHVTLSRLLFASADGGAEQARLYPSQAGVIARPSVLDERVKASFYGLQGRLQFANQRAFNLPLPHLSCQGSGGGVLIEHVAVNEEGGYGVPAQLLARCRP